MWELINYGLALVAIVMLIAVCWISLSDYVSDKDLMRAGDFFLFAVAFVSIFIMSVLVMYLKNIWS